MKGREVVLLILLEYFFFKIWIVVVVWGDVMRVKKKRFVMFVYVMNGEEICKDIWEI